MEYRSSSAHRDRLRALFGSRARGTGEVVRLVMWPMAILTAVDAVVLKAFRGDVTDDFKPVWSAVAAFLRGEPVYTANLDSVDPHYLYPPGGTLLLTPIALTDQSTGRYLFIIANAAAILVALHLLLRMFGHGLGSPVAPVCYFATFVCEPVVQTLTFGNVNGVFLLAEVVFLRLVLARRNLAAGFVLGLTVAIKPILAPLLLIPAVRAQWSVLPVAAAVPAVTTAIAWPLSADPGDYFTRNLPYSLQVRDYFNSSLAGIGRYYAVDPALIALSRALLAGVVALTLWLLIRHDRDQEVLFVATVTGVLMTGEFTLSSLGQQYYSMFALPLLLTVLLANSLIRTWPAWLAIFGFMSYDKWLLDRWPALGRDLEYLRTPFGWSLLLIAVCCVVTDRYLAARQDNRSDVGIDPPGLAPDFPFGTPRERAATGNGAKSAAAVSGR